MRSSRMLCGAAFLLLLATLLGAFGAHWLRTRLTADRMHTFETAVQFQVIHALGLMILGVLARSCASRMLSAAALLLIIGIILFSGSLYAFALGAPLSVTALAPLGGLSLIAAWALFGLAIWRLPEKS